MGSRQSFFNVHNVGLSWRSQIWHSNLLWILKPGLIVLHGFAKYLLNCTWCLIKMITPYIWKTWLWKQMRWTYYWIFRVPRWYSKGKVHIVHMLRSYRIHCPSKLKGNRRPVSGQDNLSLGLVLSVNLKLADGLVISVCDEVIFICWAYYLKLFSTWLAT